jgi:hypothetical protein
LKRRDALREWSGVITATLVAVACIDLSVDPDEIVAIELGEFAWPSIVAGDTLRDATGAIAPLVARLFDGEGDVVTGSVEFLVERPGLRVVAGDRLVADDTASGTVGIIASTEGVQSVVRQIEIVTAPRALVADGVITPLRWVVPDNPASNTSQPLGARVIAGPDTGVRSWIVTFQLEAGGRIIPQTDTTQIFLVGDTGRPSYVDTTDAGGRASRRVRLRIAAGLVAPDSAVVTIRASYKGQPLNGSPVRLVLPISPG